MKELTYFTYRSPYGALTIGANGEAITHLVLGTVKLPGQSQSSALTNRASTEVLEFLAGKRWAFDLPLSPAGSSFERQVWSELLHLAYGEQITTRALAIALGVEKSYRQVGVAVNQNPIEILIPSHRVVAMGGKPRPSAPHPGIDEALLKLEAQNIRRSL